MSEQKPRVYLEECKIKQDPNDYGMADTYWDLEDFKKRMKIVIVRLVIIIL